MHRLSDKQVRVKASTAKSFRDSFNYMVVPTFYLILYVVSLGSGPQAHPPAFTLAGSSSSTSSSSATRGPSQAPRMPFPPPPAGGPGPGRVRAPGQPLPGLRLETRVGLVWPDWPGRRSPARAIRVCQSRRVAGGLPRPRLSGQRRRPRRRPLHWQPPSQSSESDSRHVQVQVGTLPVSTKIQAHWQDQLYSTGKRGTAGPSPSQARSRAQSCWGTCQARASETSDP